MTVKEEVQKVINERIHCHSSREFEQRVKRLENVVLFLADKVDKIYQEGFEQGYDNGKEDANLVG